MAKGIKDSSYRSSGSQDSKGRGEGTEDKVELSYFEQIQVIAHQHAREKHGESNIRRFLMLWWADYYNRPLKDPLLLSYSVEELAYEYYLINERMEAREEQAKEEADKIEDEKWEDDMAWAEEEERLEKEAAKEKPAPAPDPMKDPENVKWMEEEIEKNKLLFGDNFGEDLNLDFDEE